MKRGIISMLITLAALSAAKADNIQVIHLDGGKRLGELIDRESGIDSLVVSGRMTDEDFIDLGTFCNDTGVRGICLCDVEVGNGVLPTCSFGYSLGDYQHRKDLKHVTLPKSLKVIGKYALAGLNVSSIELPQTVEVIDDGAFRGSAVSHVEFPEALKEIGADAFYHCLNLMEVELPAGLTTIGDAAFALTGLEEIVLPESLRSLGYCAFNCDNLTKVVFPSGLEEIGYAVFANAPVKEVTWPDNLTTIRNAAFYSCALEGTLRLPDGVRYIEEKAFIWNNGLLEVILPTTLLSLSGDSFCNFGIERLTCLATEPPRMDNPDYNTEWMGHTTLYVPRGCTDSYRNSPGWNKFRDIQEITGTAVATIMDKPESDNRYYRLDGTVISKPQRGLYIHHGKKVLIPFCR